MDIPNTSQNWNYFDIENKTQNTLTSLDSYNTPIKIVYSQRQNDFEQAKNNYLNRRDLLSKLGYQALPDLKQIESNETKEGTANRLVLLKEYYQIQAADLDSTFILFNLFGFNSPPLAAFLSLC